MRLRERAASCSLCGPGCGRTGSNGVHSPAARMAATPSA
ncbi:gallidermin family lantibiotic [Rhodococcoides fascians]